MSVRNGVLFGGIVFSWKLIGAWSAFVFPEIRIRDRTHQIVLEKPFGAKPVYVPLSFSYQMITDFSFSLMKFLCLRRAAWLLGWGMFFCFLLDQGKRWSRVQAFGYCFGLADELESQLFAQLLLSLYRVSKLYNFSKP